MPLAVYCGKCRAHYGNTTMAAAEDHDKLCPKRPLYNKHHRLTKFGALWMRYWKRKAKDLSNANEWIRYWEEKKNKAEGSKDDALKWIRAHRRKS